MHQIPFRAEPRQHERGRVTKADGGGLGGAQSSDQEEQPITKSVRIPSGTSSDKKSGGGTHWIAGAIKHPGALHRALHVPEGEKIPAKKMSQASHSGSARVRKMAGLAHTLKGFHH